MIRHKKARVERVKDVAEAVLKKTKKRHRAPYYLEMELPECEDNEVEFSRRYTTKTDGSIKSDEGEAAIAEHLELSADDDRAYRERLSKY